MKKNKKKNSELCFAKLSDLIIFDFDAFIDIIKEVIPFNKYEEFGYSDFVSNSTPIMLS